MISYNFISYFLSTVLQSHNFIFVLDKSIISYINNFLKKTSNILIILKMSLNYLSTFNILICQLSKIGNTFNYQPKIFFCTL